MAVTNNFAASTLDLNGVSLNAPTALVWGPDGRLYVTEVTGNVKVLTVAFGDKTPGDGDATAQFYVTDATTVGSVKSIPNFNDDGVGNGGTTRQVTGIDVTRQFDATGNQLYLDAGGNLTTAVTGAPAVTMYVTSTDQRIGAGTGGSDSNLDTNSGIITKLVQTGPDSWDAIDIVRGLARSEENHALNGLEVIQEIDGAGKLVSERIIVANGGNANAGAPSNNFAGQAEKPYSAAVLEVDLEAIKAMEIKTDAASGRSYVYDLPTLDDPTRDPDNNDPFGGNDGKNSAKIDPSSPVQIYSPGYRNAFDIEVTEDGRVWTYDNGANNSWGGRPIGEAGDNGSIDFAQAANYIATNLNNGDQNTSDDINLVAWNPSNRDNFHEITRSDDLGADRALSQGNVGPQTYEANGLTYVYGGHPNPTRAEGALAGLLFSPGNGTDDAFLLVSDQSSYGDPATDYARVVAWMAEVEADNAAYPDNGIYGAGPGALTSRVLAVAPGIAYDIYRLNDGSGGVAVPSGGQAPADATFLGVSGLPADIAEVVAVRNPIEGDYNEAGKYDGAVDTGDGSVNGLAEYTSTILDDGTVKMSGAILATDYNGELIVMGRDANGVVGTTTDGGYTVAADRAVVGLNGGSPLGLSAVGDDYAARGLSQAFQGSVWVAKLGGNSIQILQPDNGAVPVAGQEIVNPTDHDFDGIDHVDDPFEFSADNGYAIAPGQKIVIDFEPLSTAFPGSFQGTGLLGAALDGVTPNRDATTAADGADPSQYAAGLFDNGGNLIPGANAPRLQIKNVVAGSVVGAANTARDVLHTGILPSADTDRIVATVAVKNWVPSVSGGLKPGQLVGMMFGDGTQANFLRFVFGSVNGQPGFEVGYEIGDANYQAVARVGVPALGTAATETVELRLEIDTGTFAVATSYRLEGQSGFTAVDLGGLTLPAGVLRNVLTGDHTITDGDGPVATSGAAIGVLAETSAGNGLDAIDFNSIEIEAFGNELYAATGGEVGQSGSAGLDTLIYTGTDTALDPLAGNVERFDGTGSSADFALTANALDNLIRVGSGANTIATGAGADSVRGTLDNLDGDAVTDFATGDEVILEGETLNSIGTPVFGGAAGTATITVNGRTITLSGPDLAGYDPADGAGTFGLTQTGAGVRIAIEPALSPVVAISSGSPDIAGVTVRDQVVDFLSDETNPTIAGYLSGVPSKDYPAGGAVAADIDATVPDALHQAERSAVDAGKWGYAIPVENGEYLVDLYFAEIYHGINNANGAGARVFDIFVENATVADDFDIYAAAGGAAKEVVKSYTATVADGTLNIDFDASVDQAKVSGLVVWKVGGAFTPPADATAPEIVSIEVDNPASVQDGPRFAVVTLSDETGFDQSDFGALTGAELSFSGIVPDAVAAPVVAIGADGKSATLTYELTRDDNAWPNGVGGIGIEAGAYADAAGNATAAATAAFVLEANLAGLVRGGVVRAINVGTTDATPGTLGTDPLDGSSDNDRYGGAIASDALITDAAGAPVAFGADDNAWYTSPKSNADLNANVDGQSGSTGSNAGGVDLDGSAYHTYRDSNADTWTATYSGFANGTYVVELHFAELYQTAAGARVGDFYIQGDLVLDDFDAFAAAGGPDKPVSRTHNVTVTDGTITIAVDSSQGQAGYSAIVVYDAVPSNLPPTVSVGDAAAVEGGDATVTFTRTGNLGEAITVGYAVTAASATAGDYDAPATGSVVIPANSGSVTLTIPIVDDADEEGAESFTVSITGLANASNDAAIGDGAGSVTIAASDSALQIPAGGTLLELAFETDGAPLAEGGFDGVLGGSGALDAGAATAVAGGKLVVDTSDGDLSEGPLTASKNDFVKAIDLSDAALTQVYVTTQFDNPFTAEVLAANGVTDGAVPNYAQQGIVLATDGLNAQDPDQFVKAIFGGNAGNAIQMWSQGAVDQKIALTVISGAATAAFGLADIARVEMSLAVDKAAGSVAQIVTFFDAEGGILGGVRPVATPGFLTAAAVALPAPVAAALGAGTTVVGVTSTDFSGGGNADVFDSFPATWDFLKVTSPQQAAGGDVPVSIADPADAVEGGDGGTTDLVFALTAGDGFTGTLDLTLAVDGGAASVETIAFTNGVGTFTVAVPQDARWNGAETVSVALVSVETAGYARNPSAGSATGSVTEDDPADVAFGASVGDLSDDRLAPTDAGALQPGDNVLTATQQGDGQPGDRDRDYVTFTVPAGHVLAALRLDGYVSGEISPQGFLGLQAGAALTVDPVTGQPDPGGEELLGGLIFNPGYLDQDILPDIGAFTEAGVPVTGFSGALPAGTYTLWLNQGGSSTTATFNFIVTEAPVADFTLTIADAGTVLESGDAGATTLSFPLTASDGFSGDIEIAYTAGAAAGTQTVTFANGAGVLAIDVANDDADTGDDAVTVTLTGASTVGGDTFIIDAGTATGTVAEDDAVAGLVRGGVVAAFNAGGGAMSFDGIDFAAAASGADGAPFSGGEQFTDNGGGNGAQPGFGGTVYQTEINGAADDGSFSFSAAVDPAKTYFVDLYLAEIYAQTAGERQFDVFVEGAATPVLDDYDIIGETGDFNTPIVVQLPDAVAPGANGAIDLSFVAVADRAKISAIVIREAVAPVDTAPTVAAGIPDQAATEDTAFGFAVPADAFADDGGAANLTLTASLADGSPLPAWLTFDGATFGGTPLDGDDGAIEVKVSADDGTNPPADTTFTLTVADANAPAQVAVGDAPTVQETGDTGFATLVFPLTLTGGAGTETVTVAYTVDGAARSAEVTFAGGQAALTVEVPNDDADNVTEVAVVLTGVTGGTVELGAAVTATGTVSEDDAIDPADIDGDGIPNTDDPFAYDGTNGDAKALAAGGSFRQDFDTDTADAFGAAAGFSGVTVNPGLDPAGAAAGDPYGDRTTEAATRVENGVFKTASSETDTFGTGTGADNAIKDNYQSAADVTGVEAFAVEARATNVFATVFAADGGVPAQYASYGITIGAGGVDDFVKLVIGGIGNPGSQKLRVELGHENSLAGTANAIVLDGSDPGANGSVALADGVTAIAPLDVASVIFRFDVSKPAGFNPAAPAKLTGTVVLLDAGGAEIATVTTAERDIAGSFAAALAGDNPLTGGDGGVAYGVAITDWGNGAGNAFTGEWDYLEISSPGLPNAAPTADAIDAGAVDETAAAVAIDLVADANAADGDGGVLGVANVAATDAGGAAVAFTLEGTNLSIDPAQFAALSAGESATVTVSYEVTDGQGGITPNTATLVVNGLDGPFTWYFDNDGDGYGVEDVTLEAGEQPDGYAAEAGDADDADGSVYPGAAEINDGKDNDQDGATDEDNRAPVADAEALTVVRDGSVAIAVATLLDGDTDADGDALSVGSVQNAVNGTVTLAGGVVSFVPTPGFSGDASFEYTLDDGFGGTATGTVALTVTAPVAAAPIRIQAEDFDSSVTYKGQTQGAADGGKVIFLPTGQSGSATFDLAGKGIAPGTYTVVIGHFDENDGASDVGIAIASTGAPAFAQSFVLDDDATSGDAAQARSFRVKTFADVTIGEDATMTLTGAAEGGEYARIDYIEFTATQGGGGDNTAPYLAFGDLPDQTVDENAAFAFDAGALFADAEEDPLTFTTSALPEGVTFDGASGVFGGAATTPGVYEVTIFASDGTNTTSAAFGLTVGNVNQAPVSQDIPNQTLTQGAQTSFAVAGFFSDPDLDPLSYAVTAGAAPAGIAFANGVFSGVPTAPGSYEVTVTASDGAETASETFRFNVTGADDRPTVRLEAESFELADLPGRDGFFVETGNRIRLLANASGEATYALDQKPGLTGAYDVRVAFFDENDGVSTATLSYTDGAGNIVDLGAWNFDQDSGANGGQAQNLRILTFPGLTVAPGAVLKFTAQSDTGEYARFDYVELVPSVDGGNFAPEEASGVDDRTLQGLVPVSIDLEAENAFRDPEEDPLSYAIVSGPSWLTVDPATGVVSGTPDAPGDYDIVVSATDANNPGLPAETAFRLSVVDNNLPPTVVPLGSMTVAEDSLLEEAVAFSDPEGGALTYALAAGSPDWLSIDETFGFLSGTPDNGDVGVTSVEVIATDAQGASTSDFVELTVTNVNDAPETGANLADQSAVVGQAFAYALPASAFTDVDAGDTLTYSATLAGGAALPAWLTIDPATGALSGTPDSDADLAVVITATDLAGAAVSAPLALSVATVVIPQEPVVIEAETFTGIAEAANYRVESLSGASDGKVIRLKTQQATGEIETDLGAYAGGAYKVGVTYIDETDGISTARVLVDGREVGAWNFDGADGVKLNPNATTGTFAQLGNYRYVEFDTGFAVQPDSVLKLEVTAGGGEFGRIDSITLVPTTVAPENQAPSAVTLTPILTEIAEDADTGAAIRVADITVTDDGLGDNVLSVAGADADKFEITGDGLFLKEGVALDFESRAQLDVRVAVDDAAVGAAPDAFADFALGVTDVPEPPAGDAIVLRINAFGPEVAAIDGGPNWLADGAGALNSPYLSVTDDRGDTFTGYAGDAAAIPAGVPEAVLDSARSSNGAFFYDIPVADLAGNGAYRVNLYVAELFAGNATAGDRVFDASVEGVTAGTPLDNIDPAALGGGQNAAVISYDVTVTDGVLNIGFAQDAIDGSDNPIVNAIEVIALGGPVADTDGPTATIAVTDPADAADDLGVAVTYADASGIDPATLGDADLVLLADGVATGAAVTYAGSANGVAQYAIAAPAGGWSQTASYAVRVAAGAVSDAAAAPNAIAETDSAPFTITLGGGAPDDYAPSGDLDGDTVANASDPDVDGDTIANAADSFAYDAQNGRLLAAGETIALDFETDGTPYQNGFTGLLQAGAAGAALADFDEETGTAGVSGGKLRVIASNGDTGTTNTPEDDYQLGVKNSAFTVEARVDNPFQAGAADFDQLGIHVGIDSTDFVKFVFGFASGVVEFSVRDNDAESKVGGGNQPLPVGLAGFAAVDLRLVVNATSATTATVQGFATFLDGVGQPLAGAADVGFGLGQVSGALAAALFDETVGVGAGFTQTQFGGADAPFEAALDSFRVTGGGSVVTPPDPSNAEAAFAAQGDLDTSRSYGAGAVGSAVLKIMTGTAAVAASNYGANSFQVTNTGDKKIAAIFIDASTALYPDSIFDPDGKGGDSVAKPWAVDAAGNTGGYVSGTGYFLPGQDPLPNTTGTGIASNGGFKGAMVKFDPGASGGFETGETVGFSGDMDPNSIAGLPKASVDSGAIENWDVGGISGHELIGSLFTVLFDDGTTARGQLGSDKSNAGSIALATQDAALTTGAVSLTVNGTGQGGVGVYGGAAPSVIATGEPGDLVRITLTRGLDPVDNAANGVDALVENRLDRYDFKVSSAFDEQSVDVTIGPDGTFDASGLFDYGVASGTGKSSFAGDTIAPIAFVASVIGTVGGDVVPLGPVSAPIYLTNPTGAPVTGTPVDPPADGYYQIILGNNGSARFRVQFEDADGPGGTDPGGLWTYADAPDASNSQAGFNGTGYYIWGAEDSEALNSPQTGSFLDYTIFVPEGQGGDYTMRVRASRDPGGSGDQQNDIWLRIDADAEALQVDPTDSVSNNGFVKLFGAGTGNWAGAQQIDSVSDAEPNFTATFSLAPGLHTITFAGRSQGYHVDQWDLYKGATPGFGGENSTFVPGSPGEPAADTTAPTATLSLVDPDDANGTLGVNVTYADASGIDGSTHDGNDLTLLVDGTANAASVNYAGTAGGVAQYTIDAPSGGWSETATYAVRIEAGEVSDNAVPANGIAGTVSSGFGLTFGGGEPGPDGQISVAIAAPSDDWEKRGARTSADLEFGLDGTAPNQVGLRFTGLDVPDGAVIKDAYFEFTAFETSAGSASLTIAIQDSTSVEEYSFPSRPGDRAYAPGVVDWSDVEPWSQGATYRSPNIASLIEKVIADGNIDPSDALGFLIEGDGSRAAESFDFDQAHAPRLVIDYGDGLL